MSIQIKTQWLTAHDGLRLFVRTHLPAQETSVGTVVIVHGYLEHGGAYTAVATHLAERGVTTLVADLRGHGQSEGPRGHVSAFEDYLRDLDQVIALAPGPRPLLLGHSLGGLIALRAALGARPVAGLALTNPFLGAAVRIPWGKRVLAALTGRLWPTLAVSAGLRIEDLTHDTGMQRAIRADALRFDRTTAGWYRAVVQAQHQVANGGPLVVPCLVVLGMADPIASPQATLRCLSLVTCSDLTVWRREGELHEVLNEVAREALHEALGTWMIQRLKAAQAAPAMA